jgi:hypothetical protein
LTRATLFRPRGALIHTPLLICLITAAAVAQQETAMQGIGSGILPEEPRPQLGSQNSAGQISSADGTAIVSGVVLDTSGAAVSGATVSLTKTDRSKQERL